MLRTGFVPSDTPTAPFLGATEIQGVVGRDGQAGSATVKGDLLFLNPQLPHLPRLSKGALGAVGQPRSPVWQQARGGMAKQEPQRLIKAKVPRERYLARYLQVPITLHLQFPQMGDLGLFLMVYNQSLQWYFTLFNLLPMNSVLCRLLCLEPAWLNSKTFVLLVLWVSFKIV